MCGSTVSEGTDRFLITPSGYGYSPRMIRVQQVWWYGMSMATSKVTFTLDEETVNRLQDASSRLAMPKSRIVREAILEFYDRIGRLSERERIGMLRAFDELVPKIPMRSPAEVDRELFEVRRARKLSGGRTAGRNRQ
jgi:Ribbon-helix-helix domain